MVVVPVDDRDADRRVAQCFGGAEPAEAATDDDDVWHSDYVSSW